MCRVSHGAQRLQIGLSGFLTICPGHSWDQVLTIYNRHTEHRTASGSTSPTQLTLPTASSTAVFTEASSLYTDATFRKVETTFSGSEVSV